MQHVKVFTIDFWVPGKSVDEGWLAQLTLHYDFIAYLEITGKRVINLNDQIGVMLAPEATNIYFSGNFTHKGLVQVALIRVALQ